MADGYQSLYRKHRPQQFGELVGQEHVTTALRNAVREGRVGHAYLFSGPRGTGKTTSARILAKALNCLDLQADGEPCGVCENCVAIAEGRFLDLFELDAASNNSVDNIRDLTDRVHLGLGATARRKVYLVDEVHMLSVAASNALLKTLEEPPDHVVFVLATTNPEKVLPTIRSRTQHFEFTLLTAEEITERLHRLVEAEGIEANDEALATIARAGAGSARDAESLLDQALAHSSGPLDPAVVADLFGSTPFDTRIAMLDAIGAEDAPGVLVALGGLLDSGHEPRRVAEDMLRTARDAFLLGASGGKARIESSPEQGAQLQTVGASLGYATLVRVLETVGKAIVDMRGTDAADPRLVLEIALVRLTKRDGDPSVAALADRVDQLERTITELRAGGGGGAAPAAPTPRRPAATSVPAPKAERAAPAPATEPAPAAAPGATLGALRKQRQQAQEAQQTKAPAAEAAPAPEPGAAERWGRRCLFGRRDPHVVGDPAVAARRHPQRGAAGAADRAQGRRHHVRGPEGTHRGGAPAVQARGRHDPGGAHGAARAQAEVPGGRGRVRQRTAAVRRRSPGHRLPNPTTTRTSIRAS